MRTLLGPTRIFAALLLTLFAYACTSGPIEGSPEALQQAQAKAQSYKLAAGDKVNVSVFGESNLSGAYTVAPDGTINLPLAGPVKASGLTMTGLQTAIADKLKGGYVQNPNVSVTPVELRPYYILGQVNKPGKYPYSPDLTVLEAVATAEGFTYRADQGSVYIRHASEASEQEYRLTSTTTVEPGDTIRVAQRYF